MDAFSGHCHKSFLTKQEADQFITNYNNNAPSAGPRQPDDTPTPLGTVSGNAQRAHASSQNINTRDTTTASSSEEASVKPLDENDTGKDSNTPVKGIGSRTKRRFVKPKRTSDTVGELSLSMGGMQLKVDVGKNKSVPGRTVKQE